MNHEFIDQFSPYTILCMSSFVMSIYVKNSQQQIFIYYQNHTEQNTHSFRKCFYFITTIIVFVIMIVMISNGPKMNNLELAVLIIFIAVEVLYRWKIFIFLPLISAAPFICCLLVIYVCCCKLGRRQLDLQSLNATMDVVLACEGNCSICLMDISVNEEVYQLPCHKSHVFHKGCLKNWSKIKMTCPNCRAELPTIHVQREVDASHQNLQNA